MEHSEGGNRWSNVRRQLVVRRFFSRNTERLVLFVSGVVFSALISNLLEKSLAISVALLVSATILLALAGIFLFAEASTRVQSLADSMQTSVNYVEEPYRVSEGIEYRGAVFEPVTRLIEDAEMEVLVLATTYDQKGKAPLTSLHQARRRYLAAIEQNIKRRQGGTFKYIRILQFPHFSDKFNITDMVGEATTDHCRLVLKMAQTAESPDLTVAIMKVATDRQSSVIIVDRRHVAIEIDGEDPNGNSYAAGFILIEDRAGKLVEHFLRYFSMMERRSHEMTLDEFGDVLPEKD